MSSFSQTFPASLRSRPAAAAPESCRAQAPDRRPFLIPVPSRKPVASTRQYLSLFPHESEDARLTGATRSLYRRLLALNLPRPAARVEAAEVRETTDTRFKLVDTRIA